MEESINQASVQQPIIQHRAKMYSYTGLQIIPPFQDKRSSYVTKIMQHHYTCICMFWFKDLQVPSVYKSCVELQMHARLCISLSVTTQAPTTTEEPTTPEPTLSEYRLYIVHPPLLAGAYLTVLLERTGSKERGRLLEWWGEGRVILQQGWLL